MSNQPHTFTAWIIQDTELTGCMRGNRAAGLTFVPYGKKSSKSIKTFGLGRTAQNTIDRELPTNTYIVVETTITTKPTQQETTA